MIFVRRKTNNCHCGLVLGLAGLTNVFEFEWDCGGKVMND